MVGICRQAVIMMVIILMMIMITNQHPEDGGRGGRHPSCEDTQSLNKVLIITMILAFMAMKKFIAMCKSLFFLFPPSATNCHLVALCYKGCSSGLTKRPKGQCSLLRHQLQLPGERFFRFSATGYLGQTGLA